MALPPRDQRHSFLGFEGLEYTGVDIFDFEGRLGKIYDRGMLKGMALPPKDQRHLSLGFEGLEYTSVDIFNFEGRGPLVHELILGFFSSFRMAERVIDLDVVGTLQLHLGKAKRRMSWKEFILALGLHTEKDMGYACFGLYWAESARQISEKEDLSSYWRGISFAGLIACSIAGRSRAPKKYLRRYTSGRKRGDMITGGPFQIGTFRETITEGEEGALHLGPERARVYSDLSPEDKERYNTDIRDNVKMLLEGSELTKEDRESQLYDDFEHFHQNKGENIHDYYVRFTKLINNLEYFKDKMLLMQAQENGVVLDEEQLLFTAGGQDNACNTPKNVSQRKYVLGALLHNTTAQDIGERPLNVV
nr:hypothetical protein [Tanacetum cinerariifolium]